jgi:hypothetical protein
MRKKWKIEAVVIVIMLGIRPSTEAVNIIKTMKCQETNWLSEKLSEIIITEKITSFLEKTKIMKEINKTKNKTLALDVTIGFKKVKYYEHMFMDYFFIKNDSILIHYDLYSDHILYFHKKWTDITMNVSEFTNKDFEPENIYWKQLVIFPDEDDCKNMYKFIQKTQYPIACWEVRFKNGTTSMYDSNGQQIGYGIPTPSYEVLTLSGYDKDSPHDPWRSWRANADKWFNKWFETVISIGQPTNEQISYYISDVDSEYFYEIAHSGGEPTRFQTSGDGIFYTAYQLREDMKNREPIKLAILCSCEAMQSTDQGTLSYEFRKGQTNDTITIGYVGMGECPGWYDSLDWQDAMFTYIDRGYTIKTAFDLATALYPKISDCVKYVGDNKQKIIDDSLSVYNFMSLIEILRTRMTPIIL